MKPLTPADLRAGSVVWLLEVTWAEQVWRFASEAVTIASADGDLPYLAGALPRVFRDEGDLFASTTTPTSVGFEGLFFPVDVALMVARGHYLQLARAEVSQWVRGRTYEQRRVVLSGRIRSPEYGAVGEPVAFSVQPDVLDESATVPAPTAQVSATTWPDAAEAALGAPYPLIFGAPGLGLTTNLASTGGAPALLVNLTSRYLLVAGHRVEASSVRVIDITTGVAKTFSVDHRSDGLGRTVATVTLDSSHSSPAIGATDGDQYVVDWSASAGGYSGAAGDVALWLLRESGAQYDRGSWSGLAPVLSAYRLDFYLDQPQSPLRVLLEAVLPLVPVSATRGPFGLEPVLWRLDATGADAVAQLVDGENVEFSGRIYEEDDRLATEHRLTYAPRWGGEPYRTLTLTGSGASGDTTVQASGPLVSAASAWGSRPADPMDTRMVQRPETAGRVLSWRSQAYAFPWRVLSLACRDRGLGTLRRGDVVTVTSSARWLSGAVGLVREVVWEGDAVSLGVVLVSVPSRDSIPV